MAYVLSLMMMPNQCGSSFAALPFTCAQNRKHWPLPLYVGSLNSMLVDHMKAFKIASAR